MSDSYREEHGSESLGAFSPLDLDAYSIDKDVFVGAASTASIVYARRCDSHANTVKDNEMEEPNEIVLKLMSNTAKLRDEASILAKLQGHPNIVKFYGTCTIREDQECTEDVPRLMAIQMEYCSRGSLLRGIDRPRLSEYAAHLVMTDVFNGLVHMNKLGFVHRDIKPENVLLTGGGGAKLVDFGISASLSNETAMSARCGTPGFAAPEILLKKVYGAKVDSFSAGALLYYIISGKLCFSGSNVKSILFKTIRDPVDFRKSTRLECLSDTCKEFMIRLLEKEPQNRPSPQEALDLMNQEEVEVLEERGFDSFEERLTHSSMPDSTISRKSGATSYRDTGPSLELYMEVPLDETPCPGPLKRPGDLGMLCEHEPRRPQRDVPPTRAPIGRYISQKRLCPATPATEKAECRSSGPLFSEADVHKPETPATQDSEHGLKSSMPSPLLRRYVRPKAACSEDESIDDCTHDSGSRFLSDQSRTTYRTSSTTGRDTSSPCESEDERELPKNNFDEMAS